MSVEESALVQTFPPGMFFAGRRSSRFTQVGDAVPPDLAFVVGRSVLSQLNGNTTVDSLISPSLDLSNLQMDLVL